MAFLFQALPTLPFSTVYNLTFVMEGCRVHDLLGYEKYVSLIFQNISVTLTKRKSFVNIFIL